MKSGFFSFDASKDLYFCMKMCPMKVEMNNTQSTILSLIVQDSSITISGISDRLNINRSAVQKNIEDLKEAEILKREGGRFGGKWVICQGKP